MSFLSWMLNVLSSEPYSFYADADSKSYEEEERRYKRSPFFFRNIRLIDKTIKGRNNESN